MALTCPKYRSAVDPIRRVTTRPAARVRVELSIGGERATVRPSDGPRPRLSAPSGRRAVLGESRDMTRGSCRRVNATWTGREPTTATGSRCRPVLPVRAIHVADTPRHLRQEHIRPVDRDEYKQGVMAPVPQPGSGNDHPDQADEREEDEGDDQQPRHPQLRAGRLGRRPLRLRRPRRRLLLRRCGWSVGHRVPPSCSEASTTGCGSIEHGAGSERPGRDGRLPPPSLPYGPRGG